MSRRWRVRARSLLRREACARGPSAHFVLEFKAWLNFSSATDAGARLIVRAAPQRRLTPNRTCTELAPKCAQTKSVLRSHCGGTS